MLPRRSACRVVRVLENARRKTVKKVCMGACHGRTSCYNPAHFRGRTLPGASKSGGSSRACSARIAQLVEQRIENPRVGGSNPPPGTISFSKLILVFRSPLCWRPDVSIIAARSPFYSWLASRRWLQIVLQDSEHSIPPEVRLLKRSNECHAISTSVSRTCRMIRRKHGRPLGVQGLRTRTLSPTMTKARRLSPSASREIESKARIVMGRWAGSSRAFLIDHMNAPRHMLMPHRCDCGRGRQAN